jgi:hypothetical protein
VCVYSERGEQCFAIAAVLLLSEYVIILMIIVLFEDVILTYLLYFKLILCALVSSKISDVFARYRVSID